jgi:Fe-S oxidoreductase
MVFFNLQITRIQVLKVFHYIFYSLFLYFHSILERNKKKCFSFFFALLRPLRRVALRNMARRSIAHLFDVAVLSATQLKLRVFSACCGAPQQKKGLVRRAASLAQG